ncbi:amino acid permease [Myroides sp. LJL115]
MIDKPNNNNLPIRVIGVKNISKFAFFAMTASLFVTVYEYPTFAQSGKTLIFFLVTCGLFWFLPVALCSAEMATLKGDQSGGIFSWVGNTLGTKAGFAALFFQWFQVTVGFVTMLYFVIGTLSAIFDIPALNNNPWIKFSMVVGMFWLFTLLQFKGTSFTAGFAKYAFTIGIILPVGVMLVLAFIYIGKGHPVSPDFAKSNLLPKWSDFSAITAFVLAYMGVEASAPHATSLNNFKKSYPLIMIALVVVGISLSTIGGSIVSMVLVGPISSNEGLIDAFSALISPGEMSWMVLVLGGLICFGIIGQVCSWIVSPTAGLQYVATKGLLPKRFQRQNKNGVPTYILFVQGLVVTVWAAILTFGSSGNGSNMSFETAISLTVLIYLSAYIIFFISYFVVLFRHKDIPRAYEVPGGMFGKVTIASIGLLLSIVALVCAFVVPSTMSAVEAKTYIGLLLICFAITLLAPLILFYIYNKKWN